MNRIMKYITPRTFLIAGGAVLLLLGILGFIGVLGPSSDKSIFGTTWWFDNTENIADTVLGVAAILAAFLLPAKVQRYLVYAFAALGFFFGVYSLFMVEFGSANLQNPADTILHLVLGTWALWSVMGTEVEMKKKEQKKEEKKEEKTEE